jgi:4-hydroxy-2-oxoheptanedioate aldolase
MLFGIERKLSSSLEELVRDFGLEGIKCEFEAEGSTFNDVVRLRDICSKLDVDIYLKIGGAEAKRDVMDAIVLGMDGIIAPMIESEFAAYKFRKLIESIYREEQKHAKFAINIESKTSIERFDKIISSVDGFATHITFGRTDLSASYFDKDVVPDSDFILDLVGEKGSALKKRGFNTAMGGSISVKTIELLRKRPAFLSAIDKVETRKCILPAKSMLREGALARCLEFERLYLLSLKEKSDLFNKSNIDRLLKLQQRGI